MFRLISLPTWFHVQFCDLWFFLFKILRFCMCSFETCDFSVEDITVLYVQFRDVWLFLFKILRFCMCSFVTCDFFCLKYWVFYVQFCDLWLFLLKILRSCMRYVHCTRVQLLRVINVYLLTYLKSGSATGRDFRSVSSARCCVFSTPAPGYFNDDNMPDFLIHWQHGPGFPVYYHSVVGTRARFCMNFLHSCTENNRFSWHYCHAVYVANDSG